MDRKALDVGIWKIKRPSLLLSVDRLAVVYAGDFSTPLLESAPEMVRGLLIHGGNEVI